MEVFIETVTLKLNFIQEGLMNIQGQWALELGTNLGITRAGIIIFKSGGISGGDSDHIYTGHYQTNPANHITGAIEITNYKSEPITIFGRESKYKICLSGHFDIINSEKHNRPLMILDSYLNSHPAHLVRLICDKQSE